MNLRRRIVTGAAVVVILALAILVPILVPNTYATFWALVPPIIAIGLALLTKEVYSSLFIGILVGAVFASGTAAHEAAAAGSSAAVAVASAAASTEI